MARDYYSVLGVGRDATTEEIKKAFRQAARGSHPDSNPGDPQAEVRFREAAEAYEVLVDPERRRRYDRGDAIDLSDIFSGMGGFDDILRSVFGEGGLFGTSGGRTARGRDILVRVEVELGEAAFGTDVVAAFHAQVPCANCQGSGAEPGSGVVTCPQCGGGGSVRMARRSLFGTMMTVGNCPTCHGEGSLINEHCHLCAGTGAISQEVSVNVEVPAGVSTGTRLRLTGRGESGGAPVPPATCMSKSWSAPTPVLSVSTPI